MTQLFSLSHIIIQDLTQLIIVFLTPIKNSFGVSCNVLVKTLFKEILRCTNIFSCNC